MILKQPRTPTSCLEKPDFCITNAIITRGNTLKSLAFRQKDVIIL